MTGSLLRLTMTLQTLLQYTAGVMVGVTNAGRGSVRKETSGTAKIASMSACSTPSSASDSRAISYQSVGFDTTLATEDGWEPKMMRS